MKMRIQSNDSRLVFDNVCASIKKKEILHGISGVATSGEVLAIMGPSGSGKTTFLNVLAGHIPRASGAITLNGVPLNKAAIRKVAYVIQNDVFLTNLTLYETLYFTAMLRISDSISPSEKLARVDEIIDSFNLKGCMNTVIGSFLERGLSGGEKKRASIACEFLTDPDIMLIDEPTSGLDSSTAYRLMRQLESCATKYNKTIVTTIHQPSSQLYHLFCKLLLLENGRTAYFGAAADVVMYFENLGFTCQLDYNPADHCLDLLTSGEDIIGVIRQSSARLNYFRNELVDYNINDSAVKLDEVSRRLSENDDSEVYTIELRERVSPAYGSHYNNKDIDEKKQQNERGWPTSFWTQYRILTWRNYKQAKGRIIDLDTVIQSLIVGIVGGLIYFQMPDTLETFRDRMGLMFSVLIHWGTQVAVVTIIGFPGEREVVSKERRASAYRLSAYYLAKISSELPLLAVIPMLYYSAIYWVSMLGDVSQFFIFIGVNLMSCLCTQGLGHILGALIVDNKDALVISNTVIITFIILAGFFSTHLPSWLNWIKYFSLLHYPVAAMTTIILADSDIYPCNETSLETFKLCETAEFLRKEDVLASFGTELPILCYLTMLVILIVIFKIIGYFALKWNHV